LTRGARPFHSRHLIGNLEATPLENGEVEARTAHFWCTARTWRRITNSSLLPREFAAQGDRRVEGRLPHDRA
jgi:hypothetical protein